MFKHEAFHFFSSILIGIAFFLFYKEPLLIALSFLFGFFIDADHLFDYFYWSKGRFKISEFFSPGKYVNGSGKVFVLLHGWEYVFLLFGSIFFARFKIQGAAEVAFTSYLIHLLFDQIWVSPKPWGYSLLYRTAKDFSLSSFKNK